MEIQQLRDELEKAKTASLVDAQKIADRYNELIDKFDLQIDFNIHFTESRPMDKRLYKNYASDIAIDVDILK